MQFDSYTSLLWFISLQFYDGIFIAHETEDYRNRYTLLLETKSVVIVCQTIFVPCDEFKNTYMYSNMYCFINCVICMFRYLD